MTLFDALPVAVSLERQIACVDRELKFRERVYSRRVGEGKMTQSQADTEIAAMRAVKATLLALHDAKQADA